MAENPTFNMEHTEESRAFNKEFEKSKKIQDEGLDEISKGLRVLKNLGGEMDEEIKRQEPIMDTIDTKMDTVTAEMRTANGRLKSIITSMRSTRHFCIDVTLIFIILGVALYLANSFG
jgi:SYP7 family syntaxin